MMDQAKRQTPLNRQQFLGIAWAASLALLASQALLVLARFIKPVQSGGLGGQIYAGKVDEFQIGSVNYVLSGRFFLVRSEQGFLALWQKCTHLGCAVPWSEAEEKFHCPCHGSSFDKNGLVTGGPAPRPLRLFSGHHSQRRGLGRYRQAHQPQRV